MGKDSKELCLKFIECSGGIDNITSIYNCYTRVRINVKDISIVKKDDIAAIPSIIGVVAEGSQLQIIVGPGKSVKFAQEMKTLWEEAGGCESLDGSNVNPNAEETSKDEKDDSKEYLKTKESVRKKTSNKFNGIIKKISGVFVPIIPMFIACGLLLAIYSICEQSMGKSFTESDFGKVFGVVSKCVFTVLNVIVGYNATKEFGGDGIIGAALAGAMTSPLLNGVNFGFYTYNADEVGIFTILLMSVGTAYLERLLRKFMPNIIDAFVTPLITVIVMSAAGFFVLQPIGSAMNKGLEVIFTNINDHAPFLLGLVPLFYLFLVLTGTHHCLMVISTALIQKFGYTPLVPVQLMAGAAEVGAAIYILLKTKNKKLKQNIIGSLPIGFLGIDEPLIWGMSVPLKRPFIAASLGGFAAGTVLACLKITANVQEATGIQAAFVCNKPWVFAVCFIGAIIVGFGIMYLVGFKDTVMVKDPSTGREIEQTIETSPLVKWYKNYRKKHPRKKDIVEPYTIYSPVKGRIINLSEVEDETFANKVLGDGFAIIPQSDTFVAPFNGTVESIFDTKHAFGLKSEDGVEVLIHIGIDTVNLKGQYFTTFKNTGDHIVKGEKLVKVDLKNIQKAGYKITTPIIITNLDEYKNFEMLNQTPFVKACDQLSKINSK